MSEATPNTEAEVAGKTETPAQPLTFAKPSPIALVLNWRTLVASLLCFAVWFGWTQWDNIVDRCASVEGMQDRIAITVASPTVHTRERLLNDRFEQVSWLERELDLTNPPKAAGLAPDPIAGATRADAEKPTDQDSFASDTLTATSRLSTQLRYGAGDPRQLFEMMNGFRDVLRAERARAMLDDRHDVDNNTLDLFSFDATAMPRDNARGYAAVEVVLTREPHDLWVHAEGFEGAKRRLAEQKNADLFDTYVGWLEKVRDLQQSNLGSLTQALDQVEVPNGRSDYETTLRIAACSEYLLAHPAHEKSEDKRREACRKTMIGTTPHDLDKNGQDGLADEASRAMRAIDEAVVPLTRQMNNNRAEIVRVAIWPQVASQLRSAAGSLLQQQGGSRQDEEQAKALQDAADFPDRGAKSAAEIVNECSNRPPDAEVDVVSFEIAQAVARATLVQDRPLPQFPCSQIPRNASWRALFAIITSLDKAPKDATSSNLETNTDTSAVPTSCLAAMLQEESLVRPTAEQPRNHGAALEEFFNIRVDRVANGCSITVQPKIDTLRPRAGVVDIPCKKEQPDTSNVLCRLDWRLEGPEYRDQPLEQPVTRAYGYSLSPRLRQNVEVKANQNDTAGIGGAGAGFGLGSVRGLEYRGVEPEVVGFARPIPADAERRILGARFGWLISPRPGREMTWSVPLEQAQLSAVVALPSWWRSALLQICNRFVPYKALANVVTDEFWQHERQCRVEMIRLPGSAADISRRLGVDVLTTPYMEQWNSGPPVLYAGNTGEPTHLLITGERLWRNTIVTLGGQKADRIEVLPDMVGITATFDCVRKPTSGSTGSNWTLGQRAGSNPAAKSSTEDYSRVMAPRTSVGMASTEAAPTLLDQPFNAFNVPVIVWTSEGHTRPQNASVVVRTSNPFPPCPAPGGSVFRSPDTTLSASHIMNPPSTRETPQTTVQTDRR